MPNERIEQYEKDKLLLFRKLQEIEDLAEQLNEQKYFLTCEVEKLNHLIAAELAAQEG